MTGEIVVPCPLRPRHLLCLCTPSRIYAYKNCGADAGKHGVLCPQPLAAIDPESQCVPPPMISIVYVTGYNEVQFLPQEYIFGVFDNYSKTTVDVGTGISVHGATGYDATSYKWECFEHRMSRFV